MSKVLENYWSFLILYSFFFIAVFSYLGLPAFWDEVWVYLPSVEYLHNNEINLLPNSLPPELSRGHPLFFHSLYGMWAKLLGLSLLKLRLLSLIITGFILLYTFKISKDFFGIKPGILVTTLVAIQPIIFIQSTQILPEILVSLLSIIVIYSFLYEKRNLYIIAASCLLLTKESGIILIFSITTFFIINSLEKKYFSFNAILIILIPFLFPIIFFTIQYSTYDWVFFPEHISMLDFSINNLLQKYYLLHDFTFEKSGRLVLFWGAAISVALFWKHGSIWKNGLSFVLFSTLLKVLFGYWVPIEYLIIPISLLLIIILYFQWYKKWKPENPKIKSFFLLSTIFAIFYLAFSSVNFFTFRYLLAIIPIIIISQFILIYSESKYPNLAFIIVALSIGVTFYKYNSDTKIFDVNTNYKDGLVVKQKLVNYIEDNIKDDECVSCGFLDNYIFKSQLAGHRRNARIIRTENYNSNNYCKYLIFTNFDDKIDSSIIKDQYIQVYSIDNGNAKGVILKRTSK